METHAPQSGAFSSYMVYVVSPWKIKQALRQIE
jgi:hypothetical protein